MDDGSTGPIRGPLARLRHAPLWVWITIALTFGLLVFAYLQYKKNQSANTSGSSQSLGTVPADGAGQPLWSTVDTTGMSTGNWSDLQALLAYIQSLQTPNPPPTAPPGGTTTGTTVTHVKLSKPESLNDIAKQYGVSLAWLKSWNAQLKNQPGYNKPWWTLPAGTQVNIPHGSSAPAA